MEHIRSLANRFLAALGVGFFEQVFRSSMGILQKNHDVSFVKGTSVPVMLEGVDVGEVHTDLFIDGEMVVVLKLTRVPAIGEITEWRMDLERSDTVKTDPTTPTS